MNNLTITKFKLGSKGRSCLINFEWLIPAGDLAIASVEIPEPPHEDLINALDSLIYLVVESHSMEVEDWSQNGHVTGVTFKQAEANTWGLVLTAQKPVNNDDIDAPALVNSPYLTSDYLEADQPLIRTLIAEIKLCLEGKRLNGNLFRQGELLDLEPDEDDDETALGIEVRKIISDRLHVEVP